MALSHLSCIASALTMVSNAPIHGLVHPRKTKHCDILHSNICNTKFFHESWSRLNWISTSRKKFYHMRDNRVECTANKHASYSFQDDDSPDSVPFWYTLVKEAFGYFRSLVVFLVAQPGQLRYIEWPSFESTLKTATLTLALVALLIVALSSVDAALWYLSVLILRRSA